MVMKWRYEAFLRRLVVVGRDVKRRVGAGGVDEPVLLDRVGREFEPAPGITVRPSGRAASIVRSTTASVLVLGRASASRRSCRTARRR